jgi:hypothetical protein
MSGQAHFEVRFAHVLVLLDVEPKVQGVLGRFTLQEDLPSGSDVDS